MAERLSMGKLFGLILLFAALGIPLVGYLWETLNQALAFKVEPVRLVISAVALVLLAGLLLLLKNRIQTKEPRP